MTTIKAGGSGNVTNVGQDKRMEVRSISDAAETLFTEIGRKYVISTRQITITENSAIALLTNNSEDNLILSSNAIQLFTVAGSPTSVGAVIVESNAAEDTGTFSDFPDPFNASIGATRLQSFTARKGSSGATFTVGTQLVTGYFESPNYVVANTQKFNISQGNSIAITVNLPAGVTSAIVVWTASVYEDNSASIRDLG